MTDDYPELTPFQYASNDPVANIDIDGLEGGYALREVTIAAHRTTPALTATTGFWGGVRGTVNGIAKSLANTGKGLVHVATHLPQVVAGVGSLLSGEGQIRAALAASQSVQRTVQKYKQGNTFARASIIAEAATDALTVVVTSGVGEVTESAKTLEAVDESGEASEALEDASKVEEATKTTEYTKSSLKIGREVHKAYHAGEPGKEFRLPSGRRVDFLDIKNGEIHELKPYNPRAIRQGLKQLQKYRQELESMPRFKGVQWKTVLDTY